MTTNIATLAVKALIANGIDQLYCLPGVQNDHFFNALFDHTDMITPIQTRHEQGAAYMATGAAQKARSRCAAKFRCEWLTRAV